MNRLIEPALPSLIVLCQRFDQLAASPPPETLRVSSSGDICKWVRVLESAHEVSPLSLIVDLPDEVEAKMKECARLAHESETQIIQRAIEQYLTNGSSVWPSEAECARGLAQFEAARNLAELQAGVEECGEDIEPDETRNELLRRLQGTLTDGELAEMNRGIEECFEKVEPDLWK